MSHKTKKKNVFKNEGRATGLMLLRSPVKELESAYLSYW